MGKKGRTAHWGHYSRQAIRSSDYLQLRENIEFKELEDEGGEK